MTVRYLEPLGRGWARARAMLFHPFDLAKWLVIGFSAWLAGLAGGGGGGGGRTGWRGGRGPDLRHVTHQAERLWERLLEHIYWVPIILAVVVILLALFLLLLWLSSRGKLIFLDNVVHDRAHIVEPWKRLRSLGNSLFLWRLGFAVVCIASFGVLAGGGLLLAGGTGSLGFGPGHAVVATLVLVVIGVVLTLVAAYTALLLDSFVVPIMYKGNLSTTEAWRVFLPWLNRYLLHFFLYGLFVLAVVIAFGIVVLTAGLFTCCVGLLILAVPYVGTVILLPAFVTYRAFSLEFLGQLDPGLALLPPPPTT